MPALLALLLLATEIPLTTPAFGPAALAQYGAIAASDGDGYLVLWTDGRAQRAQTRATRVSRDGDVLDPAGLVVATGDVVSPAVVWTGTSYLVVYGTWESNATWGVRIDRDGRIVDGPRVLLANAFPSAVASNGTDVVLGYHAADGSLRARLLNSGADVVLAAGRGERYAVQIVATGSRFTAFWSNQIVPPVLDGRIRLEGVRFDAAGAVDAAPRVIMDAPYMIDLKVATDGSDFVAVWRAASNLLYARAVSGDLATAGAVSELPEPILSDPTLLWSGNDYVLVGDAAALRAVRLDRQGRPGDAQSFDDPSFTGTARSPAVATNGTDLLVAWNGSAAHDLDVFATLVAESTLERRRRTLLTLSAPRQTRPILTSGGTNLLAVWTENDALWATRLGSDGSRLDAAPLRLTGTTAWARVTFHGDGYLVAWYDSFARELVTLRVPRDGALRVDGEARFPIAELASFDMASTADVTLVAWSAYHEIRALRLRGNGTAIDTTPLTLVNLAPGETPGAGRAGCPPPFGEVDVASNGTDEFLVVWGTRQETDNPHAPLVAHSVRGARVTSELASLDPNGFDIAASVAPESDPSAAWNGSEWLAVWSRSVALQVEIRARRIAANGTLPGSIAGDDGTLLATGGQMPEVTSDGTRVIVAWSEQSRMHAAWLTSFGSLTREVVVEGVDTDWSIAPLRPGLFAAAYTRVTDEPQAGGVHRAFVSLQQAPQPKQRAVR